MPRPRTTTIVRQDNDYFIAQLDNGGTRVGVVGLSAVDYAEHIPVPPALSADEFEEFACRILRTNNGRRPN